MTDDAGAATAARTAQGDDVVELRLPADGAYLSVLRTATAGLAASDRINPAATSARMAPTST